MKRIVIGIYIDPDFYPPTINAILNLSTKCEELIVVTRNNSLTDYDYPANVMLVKTGAYLSVRDTEAQGLFYKVRSFLQFSLSLLKYSRSSKTDLILLYDPMPLFSFFLIKNFLKKKKKNVWYHNHDMPNISLIRKFSIGWLAAKYEQTAMNSVQFFSLPSNDRLVFYPKWKKAGNYFCIPNYPSLKVYTKMPLGLTEVDEVRVIFQGSIGEGHALEELIALLRERIAGKKMRLILKGSVRSHYRQRLDELASKYNVSQQLTWIGLGPYSELPKITSSCHIGIAIHTGNDDVRKTLGTASNKIYEYAASGLPVILYDTEQFRKYLEKYDWAFFSNTSVDSLRNNIALILDKYPSLSRSARKAFEAQLNFEGSFEPIAEKVMRQCYEQ